MIVAEFFQPQQNLAMLAALGVNTFCGPEVPNAKALAPADLASKQQAWIKAVQSLGCKMVLKRPPATLPTGCIGVMLSVDEPNGRGVSPLSMKAESDAFRATYPGVDIWLSLAGDKVTSANFNKPAELQLYKDFAALADVLTVDTYSKNRNASRYPTTWTGDAVKKLHDATGKRVLAWVEMNDQQLPPPAPPDVNREPTPEEIQATVDYAVQQGAWGIGWFSTCDSGKYGWPASYFPTVNRAGASMQPQIDKVKAISMALGGSPQPAPAPTDPALAELQATVTTQGQMLAELATKQAATDARQDAIDAKFNALADVLRPATRPTTQPGGMP